MHTILHILYSIVITWAILCRLKQHSTERVCSRVNCAAFPHPITIVWKRMKHQNPPESTRSDACVHTVERVQTLGFRVNFRVNYSWKWLQNSEICFKIRKNFSKHNVIKTTLLREFYVTASFSSGGERGIWTLATLSSPTPLAGEPLHHLGISPMGECDIRDQCGGEGGIRTHGALLHHQFSRLAP